MLDEIDKRFDDMNKKFSQLQWSMGIGFTVLTGVINHLIFLIAVVVIFVSYRVYPAWYWFQTLYYLFVLSMFLLGIPWFTSLVGVFMLVVGILTFRKLKPQFADYI